MGRSWTQIRLSVVTLFLLILTGCALQPPERDETAPLLPAQWHTESAAPSEGKSPSAGWDFGSEELRRLLAEAEAASLDVAAAVARVRQAEAAARIAGAPLLPEVTAGMEAGRQGNYHQRPSSGFDAGGVPVNIALFRRLTHNAVTIFHA